MRWRSGVRNAIGTFACAFALIPRLMAGDVEDDGGHPKACENLARFRFGLTGDTQTAMLRRLKVARKYRCKLQWFGGYRCEPGRHFTSL